MACPTCDHTMQRITDELDGNVFWCPRCGSLRTGETSIEQPTLVKRCQEFSQTLGPSWRQLWHKLGIAEAITRPGRECNQ